ncbi:hypothetical protein D5018_12270 [Parashewanella curva]|uniref:Uncharacterized protein n=1 Tax=Parashewanella curva TaxID=2338552 RepID=A0A3L8PVN5_9GAMM|nr:hypothetical protein [Parashewanella curva]RLV59401.1 hypothetical protein D5018_12270 [Parashewanella curva]
MKNTWRMYQYLMGNFFEVYKVVALHALMLRALYDTAYHAAKVMGCLPTPDQERGQQQPLSWISPCRPDEAKRF